MLRLRGILALSIPTTALALLAPAVPAEAAGDSASCSVTGSATTNPAVQLQGGSGSYSFDVSIAGSTALQFNCLGVNASGQVDVETLSVSSTGTYSNIVCGTGSADGTNTGITATSLGVPGTTNLTGNWTGKNLSYHIDFVAGVGVLRFTDSGTSGGGVVTITASNPQTDGVNCTNGFKVVGVVTIQGSGGGSNPSDTCKNQGGANALGDDPQVLGVLHPLVYVWTVSTSPPTVDVCVRAQAAATSKGGLIEVVTAGSPGVTPVVNPNQPYSTTKCPMQIVDDPLTGIKIYTSNPGTNPASICVAGPGGVSNRTDVGYTGSPTPPLVCWTPDPAGPRTCPI
jgi:hypothetical protein